MAFLVNKVRKIKSQLKVSWLIAIFLVAAVTMLLLGRIVNIVMNKLYQEVAEASSQNVAIQLSSLMSSSGSAPNEIYIEYLVSKDVLYDVLSNGDKKIQVFAKFSQPFIASQSSTSKFCTNFTQSFEFRDVNDFLIQKVKEGYFYYKISARRVS
jgi:hypothetical protein